jgi:tRNA A-37 threonylcarbamoyl transferase component Bud32
MIIPTTVKLPFLVTKEKEHSPEGRFALHFYGHKIIHKNRVMYKYYPLRFDGEIARFKARKEAREYASYRLGID